MVPPPIPTRIYHFTHIGNLQSILESGGLVCHNRCQTQRVGVAHEHIQNRRRRRQVPCGPGGNLHDYVPFYFGLRSPMLYAIHGGRVACYEGGQGELVYLVSSVQRIVKAGLGFVFTERHAVLNYAEFFTDLINLAQVDWNLMPARWWNDIPRYPDRKERKQAEFLVHGFLPWDLVESLAVMNPQMQRRVETLFAEYPASIRRLVRVERDWYY